MSMAKNLIVLQIMKNLKMKKLIKMIIWKIKKIKQWIWKKK